MESVTHLMNSTQIQDATSAGHGGISSIVERTVATKTLVYLFCSLGLIENSIILALFYMRSGLVVRSRRLFSQAITTADALLALGILSLRAFRDACLPLGCHRQVIMDVHNTYAGFFSAFLMTSQWSQLGYVVDRFIMVTFPLHHKVWFTAKRIQRMVAAVCTASAASTLLLLVRLNLHEVREPYSFLVLASLLVLPALPSLVLFISIQVLVFRIRFNRRLLVHEAGKTIDLTKRIKKFKMNLIWSAMMSFATTLGFPMFVCLHVYLYLYVHVSSNSGPASYRLIQASTVCQVFAAATLFMDPWIFSLAWGACWRKLRRLLPLEEPITETTQTNSRNSSSTVQTASQTSM